MLEERYGYQPQGINPLDHRTLKPPTEYQTMSLKESIQSYTPQVEPVSAFGTTVYVKAMTGHEIKTFQQWASEHKDTDGMDAINALVVRTLCDEQGQRIYQDDEADQLLDLPSRDVQAVYQAAERINSVTQDDVDEAVKN